MSVGRRRTFRLRSRNYSLEDQKFWTQSSISTRFDTNAREFINRVNEMEQNEKLFKTYDLIEFNQNVAPGVTIYEFINQQMKTILKCDLTQIQDLNMVELILSSFFKRKNLMELWIQCEHPIYAGLLVVYICNKMRKLFQEQHEPVIAETFEKIQIQFDDECTKLLDRCFHASERDTRAILDTNYHVFIHTDQCLADSEDMELMALASYGKAKNFLAHPACQREIDERWQPGFKLGQISFFFFFFIPVLFFLRGRQRIKKRELKNSSNAKQGFFHRIRKFYTSPNSKYLIHTIFRFTYVVFYAYVLMTKTRKTMVLNEFIEFWDEIVIIVWQCAYLVEMAVLVWKKGLLTWSLYNTADLYRNYLVIGTLSCWTFAVILPSNRPITSAIRAFLTIMADFFFYFSFVFATIRLMKIANVDAFFGSIVLMIKKMMPIMIKFMLVFMPFWFTYAVCHISLAGHLKRTPNITDVVWPWLIFSSGAFEIFGEADDEDKLGEVSHCSSSPLNWDFITDSAVECWFKTSMIPIFLFCYMLVSSVLLVNLVTALLSKKYEDIDKMSHIYWKYKLYSRLIEYEEKLWLPAPLSLIFYILKIMFVLMSKMPLIGVIGEKSKSAMKFCEGRVYAKCRTKKRRLARMEFGADGGFGVFPTDIDKIGAELVKQQMHSMEKRKEKRSELILQRQIEQLVRLTKRLTIRRYRRFK